MSSKKPGFEAGALVMTHHGPGYLIRHRCWFSETEWKIRLIDQDSERWFAEKNLRLLVEYDIEEFDRSEAWLRVAAVLDEETPDWHRLASSDVDAAEKAIRKLAARPGSALSLRELQTRLPWTIRYSEDFRSSPCTHKDFAHALHHVSKAAGKLHALADDMDHDRALADDPELGERYGKYIADLVVCALRLANTFPGRTLDLQALTVHRIESKNGVSITSENGGRDDG